MAFEYLETLNPEQTEAVVHSGSPLLILAGAGSGKTRVITTKIAYLIQHENVEPWSILAVTFTKKAANEMKERAILLEPKAGQSQIKTFHSFGAWFLRRYAETAGLEPNFTVFDDDDSVNLLIKAMPTLTKKNARELSHKIALCKDYCLTPNDDLSRFDDYGNLSKVYEAYQTRLSATGNADFGDLIMKVVQVLEQDEDIRRQMQHRFRVVMVDEYQDSNVAQFRLLKALTSTAEKNKTYVCVVGDDDQSIYKFRGAEVQNILQFPNYFKGTQIIKLERNYRSMEKILVAADAVVSNNSDRLGKTLVAVRGEGKKPVLAFLENQEKEAEFCVHLIKTAVKQGAKYSDFALLYRTNAQSLSLETEFIHKKVPYVVVGSLKFYDREEIKDVLSYLSFIANSRNEIAFSRIANKPVRGVGEKSQAKIIEAAYDFSSSTGEKIDFLNACERSSSGLSKKVSTGLKEFVNIIKTLKELLQEKSKTAEKLSKTEKLSEEALFDIEIIEKPTEEKSFANLSDFVRRVIEDSGLSEYHKTQDKTEGTTRVQNMIELANAAMDYPYSYKGLVDFLDTIELDRTLAKETDEDHDAVTLITLHNTKGLEFNRVIITGLENGIFPREDESEEDLEEERRLFYVGITRAKDELYITSCAMRRIYGRLEAVTPSIFLKEAGDVFNVMGRIPYSFKKNCNGSKKNSNDDEDYEDDEYFEDDEELSPKYEILKKWQKGLKVYHDDYGYGHIIKSDDSSGEVVITVQFENGESKRFMPEYQSRSLDIIKD